jgi:hypothetical protein
MKSKLAFRWSLEKLFSSSKSCYLWTLTIPDNDYHVAKIRDYSHRMNLFFRALSRKYKNIPIIRVYEFGEENGRFHCHFVTNKSLYIRDLLQISKHYGLGRINVKKCNSEIIPYLEKYLSKGFTSKSETIRKYSKGLRKWGVRNFDYIRVYTVKHFSLKSTISKKIYAFLKNYMEHRKIFMHMTAIFRKMKYKLLYFLKNHNEFLSVCERYYKMHVEVYL